MRPANTFARQKFVKTMAQRLHDALLEGPGDVPPGGGPWPRPEHGPYDPATPRHKVKLQLVGLDGNAFNLMAQYRRAARQQGVPPEEIQAVLDDCRSGDYDHLLQVLMSVCDSPEESDGEDDEEYGGADAAFGRHHESDNSCDQCNATMIQGVFTHEHGCPNKSKTKRGNKWTKETDEALIHPGVNGGRAKDQLKLLMPA
jgi:hypothetical protein